MAAHNSFLEPGMLKKTLRRLSLASLCAASFGAHNAWAEGLNSENLYPAIDNKTGILWETPRTLPDGAFMLGYTMSYSLHPVELGDGKDDRMAISDHLEVNHFAASYGILPWLDVGANLPLAFYSAPSNPGGYLVNMDRNRNFFFLGDIRLRAKANLQFMNSKNFQSAVVLSANAPTGSRAAMLTDDSMRLLFEMPLSLSTDDQKLEFFFTPGASVWEQDDRVYGEREDGTRETILKRSSSLLLAGGARYWMFGNPVRTEAGSLVIDGGIRGDYVDFVPSLGNCASVTEWSGGAGFFLTRALSVHGAYGAGLGCGAGAPLSRLVAGVRYVAEPAPVVQEKPKEVETMVSSEAFTDQELEQIIEQAQREPQPPRLGEEETLLKLKMEEEVIDLGSVRFEFNSSRLTPEAKQTVLKLHEILARVKPKSVKIDGHTDSIGSYAYNLGLSKRRAESVKAELERLGENGGIISTEGFAFKYPVATNGTKEGRAQNRRIEVALDGKSFRKQTYTKEEMETFRRWIYPNGKQPKNSK